MSLKVRKIGIHVKHYGKGILQVRKIWIYVQHYGMCDSHRDKGNVVVFNVYPRRFTQVWEVKPCRGRQRKVRSRLVHDLLGELDVYR